MVYIVHKIFTTPHTENLEMGIISHTCYFVPVVETQQEATIT
jgi:hypothetical protein